ncbi:glycosyltransferase family 2 protein [Pedococcus bigeumensis]|uniref:Glycosyltransferase family 2 protein n=1 Tax=Pedococcus bigeumensis TaxID=433644 RepID=A0A502D3P7_9MICO|nr:glycosyltransferase family 2 protein [Pedococcus bigeumensis]TPG19818.1 glycosyltransferase family 2 protein [Pedococcus bigeumensis]
MTSTPPEPHLVRSPRVGVVMPILNEQRHLEEAVAAVLEQDYPGDVELVLALGPSRDDTDAIAERICAGDPRVSSVPNPSGRTPEGLNAALARLSTDTEVVVRVDGHGLLDPDYISTACALLEETGAANVGGLMDARGVTSFERAVAAAMTSRLGVGAAAFHTGGEAGPADTVYLGVFSKPWLDRMGGYDPRFVRAQDWELNHRIREAGGLVWFSPGLRVTYRPRPTLRALARQYRDYGRWRRAVSRTHAGTLNLRYLAPPAALVGVVVGLAGGFVWWPLWLGPAAYLAITTVGGLTVTDEDLRPADRLWMPLVLPTMHLCWGWGFITSRVRVDGETDSRPAAEAGSQPAG